MKCTKQLRLNVYRNPSTELLAVEGAVTQGVKQKRRKPSL